MTGAYSTIEDINNPHIQELGKFAVAEHNKQTSQELVFVAVVAGEQQVVAGINYKLVIEAEDAGTTNKYEAVVYEKPWENLKQLISFHLLNQLGGWEPIEDTNDPEIHDIAVFAVTEHNKLHPGNPLVFVAVVSGEKQVVAGIKYKLVIETKDAGVIVKYEAVVYDRPWDKVRILISFKLLAQLGGYKPIKDIKDPHIKGVGKFAVEEHNKQTGQALVFVSVVSGEEQVVAGVNYKLVIKAKDGGVTKRYVAVVYEKPWAKTMELTSFEQLPDPSTKRGWLKLLRSRGKA